jgi:large subunit ribosomal protein L21
MYAILSHGGRQHRVRAGDRLVVDRLDAEVGSVIALEPVLLTGGEGKTALGADLDGTRVAVTVVKHLRGDKLRIFKYKAKKRSRKVAGYRSALTELRVESILTKGAALPKPNGAEADKPAAKTAKPARAAAADQPAAKAAKPARAEAADQPAAKAAATAKRASKAPAAAAQDIEDTDKDTDKAGSTQRATAKTAAARPRAPRTTKAAPKAGRGGAADGGKESGDGA